MRVGLLQCDHVDDRYRSIAGDYDEMFATLLPAVDLVPYDVVNDAFPSTADECDAWLATGSRYSVYDDRPWIGRLCGFVRDTRAADAPFVGICFGHQVLALALGGTVTKAPTGWGVGRQRIDVQPADEWNLFFMHQDQVMAVPAGADVVGWTDHCEIAMFRVGESMLGLQAHPEFGPDYVDALLDARVALIGDDEVAKAKANLRLPTDERIAADAMMRVLTTAR